MPLMTDGQKTLEVSNDPSHIAAMVACGYEVVGDTPAPGEPAPADTNPEPEAGPVEESVPEAVAPPLNAARPRWVEYAKTLDIDASEMNRDQIQAAVAALAEEA